MKLFPRVHSRALCSLKGDRPEPGNQRLWPWWGVTLYLLTSPAFLFIHTNGQSISEGTTVVLILHWK